MWGTEGNLKSSPCHERGKAEPEKMQLESQARQPSPGALFLLGYVAQGMGKVD